MKEGPARRLADLSTYGDAYAYMFASLVLGAAVGGLLGWSIGHPSAGASAGGLLGFIAWLVLVVRARHQVGGYQGSHLEEDDPA